mgnify:CR=1 FL=1
MKEEFRRQRDRWRKILFRLQNYSNAPTSLAGIQAIANRATSEVTAAKYRSRVIGLCHFDLLHDAKLTSHFGFNLQSSVV